MGRITAVMKEYFEAEGWDGQEPDEGVLVFRFEDDLDHQWGCLAVAHEEAEQLAFYSVVLSAVPPERRAEVTDFIMRTNYGMQVGNFEMDLDDGEIRFKTSIDVEGVELDRALCDNLVSLNLMIMGTYFDGLMAVVSGEKRALEVVGEFEHYDDDDEAPEQ
ncbi:MAG: YbjN domain-containing protein [Nannocystaceae bacterium]